MLKLLTVSAMTLFLSAGAAVAPPDPTLATDRAAVVQVRTSVARQAPVATGLVANHDEAQRARLLLAILYAAQASAMNVR